jgi:hypothetical protein
VRLYPASLIITAAVLLPNLLFLVLPPLNAKKYGTPADSFLLTTIERIGQVSCFALPVFFPMAFAGTVVLAGWIMIGITLGFSYAGWIRFFSKGRDYALLFKPMAGIPVPLATSPVLCFLFASLVLGSVYQAAAAVVLGAGHIGISILELRRIGVAPAEDIPPT